MRILHAESETGEGGGGLEKVGGTETRYASDVVLAKANRNDVTDPQVERGQQKCGEEEEESVPFVDGLLQRSWACKMSVISLQERHGYAHGSACAGVLFGATLSW